MPRWILAAARSCSRRPPPSGLALRLECLCMWMMRRLRIEKHCSMEPRVSSNLRNSPTERVGEEKTPMEISGGSPPSVKRPGGLSETKQGHAQTTPDKPGSIEETGSSLIRISLCEIQC